MKRDFASILYFHYVLLYRDHLVQYKIGGGVKGPNGQDVAVYKTERTSFSLLFVYHNLFVQGTLFLTIVCKRKGRIEEAFFLCKH